MSHFRFIFTICMAAPYQQGFTHGSVLAYDSQLLHQCDLVHLTINFIVSSQIFNFMPVSNSTTVRLLVPAMHLYGLLCLIYNTHENQYYWNRMPFLLFFAFLFPYSYFEEDIPCQVT